MKVSIITVSYNNVDGLIKTAFSVFAQSYSDIEYIIIDGGSRDGSKEFLEENSSRIDYWVSEPDSGIYNAMNKGVAQASGDYLLFLNSGDTLYSDTVLQEVSSYLDGTDLIMGRVRIVPSGRIGWDDIPYPITLMDFIKGGPVPHQATFINRRLFDKRLYDERLRIVSDWKFFLQSICFDNCSYKIIDCIVSNFEEGGISANRERCDEERTKVLQDVIPPSIRADYRLFLSGEKSDPSRYEEFFKVLERYKYGRIVYSISVLFVRFVGLFKRSARFAKRFPVRLPY